MKILRGKTAAVTGAASGIGRMLAVRLAGEGCRLALADIDETGLRETASLLDGSTPVSLHVTDVARKPEVDQFAAEAANRHGGVDLIINNAGVALGDLLEFACLEDFEWLMAINFWGVVYGTMAFLPLLRQRSEGHIVNVSSVYGLMPAANTGAYCAAKFAVRGYTETLAQELRGTGIEVSCVFPGGIRTGIARSMRFNRAISGLTREEARGLYETRLLKISADTAARTIIAGIRRNRRRILIGTSARAVDLAIRCCPVAFADLSNRVGHWVVRSWQRRGGQRPKE